MKARPTRVVFIHAVVLILTILSAFARPYGIPQRNEDNVVVASYNIKWLGQSNHDPNKLAQVIEHFDVCGILEVKDEAAVCTLADARIVRTHRPWGYVYGIRTHRPNGMYHEACAALWRRDRVQLGQGVISNIWDRQEVYRNDPYVVSFKRGNFDFALLLVHTRWTDDSDGSREQEVLMLAEHVNWFRSFLKERDFILAGDFNYLGTHSVMQSMAQAAGMVQIDSNAKSTFKSDYSGYSSSYDHIYISPSDTTEFLTGQSGVLDATALVYGDNSVASMKKSKQELSDHLPVWAVFDVTQPDDD